MDSTPEYGPNLTPPPDRAAWNPAILAVIALLLNFLPASIFHALNYGRLGAPQLTKPRLIQYCLVGLIMFMSILALELYPNAGPIGYAPLIVNAVFAFHFYKSQASLYEKHIAAGGKKASLLAPLCVSLAYVLAILGFVFLVDQGAARFLNK